MVRIKFLPLPTDKVSALRKGARNAYNCSTEHVLSEGAGNSCRHCLNFIPKGFGMLILAYRPFDYAQPYAETGPIFLCAGECEKWSGIEVPPILVSPNYLLKGYTVDQRIRYATVKIVANNDIAAYASELLNHDDISFVDVRSARNNCFQVRIVRAA